MDKRNTDEDDEFHDHDDLHRYVQFRLGDMDEHPRKYGRTREAVVYQLMLIAEFALLAFRTSEDETFDELLSMFHEARVDALRAPDPEWVKACVDATGRYISMKIMAAQAIHDATCKHCNPHGPRGQSN